MGKERTFQERLFGKFPDFNPAWPDKIKRKWFNDFRRLIRLIRKRKKDLVKA